MTKTQEQMAHHFPQYDDETLKRVIDELNRHIIQLQKAKVRAKLPQMQRDLHAMRMEYKRREGAAKRAKYAITPSAR